MDDECSEDQSMYDALKVIRNAENLKANSTQEILGMDQFEDSSTVLRSHTGKFSKVSVCAILSIWKYTYVLLLYINA